MTRKTKTKGKKTTKGKPMHSVSTLKKLEAARARLSERSGNGNKPNSIAAWIRMNVAAKAAIEQWMDTCLEGNSDWSGKRMLQDLGKHFDYPFSIKSSTPFKACLRELYGERYDLAIEMANNMRSERG